MPEGASWDQEEAHPTKTTESLQVLDSKHCLLQKIKWSQSSSLQNANLALCNIFDTKSRIDDSIYVPPPYSNARESGIMQSAHQQENLEEEV